MADFARTHPRSILPANACNHSSPRFGPGRFRAIGIFSELRASIPTVCCVKAQGWRLCGTFWVTSDIDVTQNAPRQTTIGKDCYAGVAFKQTWIEDKQCVFALWFLQLL